MTNTNAQKLMLRETARRMNVSAVLEHITGLSFSYLNDSYCHRPAPTHEKGAIAMQNNKVTTAMLKLRELGIASERRINNPETNLGQQVVHGGKMLECADEINIKLTQELIDILTLYKKEKMSLEGPSR